MDNIIPKGCTVKNIFTFPYSKDDVSTIYITYQQQGCTVLEKTKENCVFLDNKVEVELSQEDTLAFSSKKKIEIQIRCKLINGIVLKSNILEVYTDDILKDGAI